MLELNQIVFRNRVESRLKATTDVEEFKYVLHEFIQELGFSDYVCGAILGDKDFEMELMTIPNDVIQQYIDRGIYQYDVMLECVFASTAPMFQQNIFDHILKIPYECESVQKNMELKSIMDEQQFYDSLAIPVHDYTNNRKQVVSMSVYCKGKCSADFQEHAMRQFPKLSILVNASYTIGYARYAKSIRYNTQNAFSKLSKKELEVLRLFGKYGVNSEEVAKILCRSKYTVRKHAENIRKKLNVETTDQAILLGIKEGIIKL